MNPRTLKKNEEAVNSAKIAAVCDLLVFGFGVVVVVTVRHCGDSTDTSS